MPKISVIVPIYNVSAYLHSCLDSLLCQTYDDLEVIGVDDNSTDGSADIFASYLFDKRFHLVGNYENQGLPSARNLGILNAKGEYLYFVDSDDWVSPDAIASLLKVAERDAVDIAIGGVSKYFDENGRLEIPDNHGKVMAEERVGVNINSAPVLFNSVTSWNKLIRSDFVKKQGLIFKSTPRRYEDMLTYKWYLSGARVSNISMVTYYYRQRKTEDISSSIMQDTSVAAYSDKILAYADILSFTQAKGHFLSKADPLHSNESMMNLPRALSWIVPKVFTITPDDSNQLFEFIMALKKLVLLLDDNYIEHLSGKIRPAMSMLKHSNPSQVMDYCNKLFAK